MKICFRCKQILPYHQFTRSNYHKDGYCSSCKPCRLIYTRERYHTNRQKGLCNKCSNLARPGLSLCEAHKIIKGIRDRRRSDRLQSAGWCPKCTTVKAVDGYTQCEKCCIVAVGSGAIRRAVKGYNHTPVSIPDKRLFYKAIYQKYLDHPFCPHTGSALFIGNMHLDHIKPITTHPALALDLNNLQWVDAAYNRAKGNMTEEEFHAKYIFKLR